MPRSNLVRPHNLRGLCRSCFFSAVFCAWVAIVVGTPEAATAQEALLPGQAFVTQFSGTTTATGADGVARTVIDVDGASGVAIDLRVPGFAPDGRHWMGDPHLFAASAGDVGQVFGVALDDAPAPNIYLTATALFGLHRNLDNSGWMEGMWGRGGGPGTVYKLNAADGYRPEVFAEIAFNGRPNSGAAFGNIAFDPWNRQFYVSDLETGMIHRLGLADGADLGQYDHGVSGRSSFFDAVSGVSSAFAPVGFDPATAAHIADCPTGDFVRTVSCWNMADFRRRVFGLGVRRDATTGEVRLYYSMWSSQGFGNLAWASAGEEQKNTLWSVAIGTDGDFDLTSVRREAVLPDFFVAPEDIARAGYGHPVADIAFPAFGDQTVMLLAERGGVRNLGLSAEDAFAIPHEARVLRYEIDAQGVWQPVGRYDVGFYDRQDQGTPYIRANAAGGVAFGFGYDAAGAVDLGRPNGFVWMTGDALCSPGSPCFNPATGAHDDQAEVHGIEGRDQAVYEPVVPDAAFRPYPAPGPATPASGPDSALMVDSNVDFDTAGNLIADLGRNDATRIGDIAIYQIAPNPAERPVAGPWYGPWQGSWPWPVPTGDYPPLPAPPPGEAWPELALEKTAPPRCAPTDPCPITITATNDGPGVYEGPLHVLDTPGGLILAEHSAGWTCEQPVLGGGIGCRSDWVTLAPRESVALELTLGWPGVVVADGEDATLEFHNCGFIVWPQALEGAARIRAVEAALLLLDIDPGPVDGIYDADTQAAIDRYRGVAGLPPDEIDDELLASLFPGASSMAGDGVPGNDWSCAPIRIPLGPGEGEGGGPGEEPEGLPEVVPFIRDLEVTKELAPGLCRAGATCTFVVNVTNLTEQPYEGPVVIYDQAEILDGEPLPDGSVNTVVAELNCDTLAGEGVRCAYADDLVLDGGGGLGHFIMRVTVPEDMAGQTLHNCAWLGWDSMAFPGGSDIDAGNDRRCADVAFDEEGAPVEPPAEPEEEPEALNVDLEIVKTPPASCEMGHACRFDVTVTNHSPDTDFHGTLVVNDQAGATEMGDDSGVLPEEGLLAGDRLALLGEGWPWACELEATVIHCRLEDVSIPAGAHIDLHIPALVRGDDDFPLDRQLTNCIELTTIPADSGPAANRACASVPVLDTNRIDLSIDKIANAAQTCRPGARCAFTVIVTNEGDAPFTGRIVFNDDANYDDGALLVQAAAITNAGDWDCTDFGDTEYDRRCSWTGTIPAGGDERIAVYINVREDIVVDAELENCAEFAWSAMDYPGGRDTRSDNDRKCVTKAIVADPAPAAEPADETDEIDLRVEKHGPETCVRGEVCEFSVTIFNDGSGDYTGTLQVVDDLPGAPSPWPATVPPEWICPPILSDSVYCLREQQSGESVTLGRFRSRSLFIRWVVPDDQPLGEATNCAFIEWGLAPRWSVPAFSVEMALHAAGFSPGALDGVVDGDTRAAIRAYRQREVLPAGDDIDDALRHSLFPGTSGLHHDIYFGNNEDCVTVDIVHRGADISIISDTSCQRGASCLLETRLENVGTEPFEGSLGMRGQLSPAVPIASVTSQTSGVTCSVTDEASYKCFGEGLSIEPGADNAVRIEIVAEIPDDFEPNEISHIKKVLWPDPDAQDGNATNDRHISTILIEGPETPQQVAAPDLAVDKVAGQGSCVAGQVCPFVVTVTNVGAGTYVGPIRIADVVAATNATLSASELSRWSCRRSGAATTCTDPSATLAPGESTRLSLSLTPPRTATGSFNNCASLAWNDTTRTAIVQNALNQLGFDAGPVDGKVGPRTHGAVHAFEERAGLPATAQINQALLQRLFGIWATGDANAANDEDCAGVVLEPATAPTIGCDGGSVSNNECVCLPGATREQVATHAWRCVTPRPVATCVGGTIQGNRCVCPTGTESQPAGPGAFRCVATTPSLITCTGGSVVDNQCVCPKGTILRPTATNSYRCARQAGPSVPPIVPQLTCQGGTVQKGQCVCPAGKEREQVLPGVFRCQTVAPSIQCGGGKIENNRCICPQGMEAQLRAPNIYKCVAPAQAPSIRCSGGSVQNNQCVCPQGMRSRKVSDRAYRCVKSEAPSQATPSAPPTVTPSAPPAATAPPIQCSGGSVKNGKCICPAGTRRQRTATNAYRCAPLVQGPLQRIVPRLLHK